MSVFSSAALRFSLALPSQNLQLLFAICMPAFVKRLDRSTIHILRFQKFMRRDEKSGVDRDKSVPYLLKNNKKQLFGEIYYFPKT